MATTHRSFLVLKLNELCTQTLDVANRQQLYEVASCDITQLYTTAIDIL